MGVGFDFYLAAAAGTWAFVFSKGFVTIFVVGCAAEAVAVNRIVFFGFKRYFEVGFAELAGLVFFLPLEVEFLRSRRQSVAGFLQRWILNCS